VLSREGHTHPGTVGPGRLSGAVDLKGSQMNRVRRALSLVRWHARDDGGALSLMIVILFPALVCLAGIVVDGGGELTGQQNAYALAQEAARAGANAVNTSRAYSTGTFVVNQQQAIAAAGSYLVSAGHGNYSVSADGSRAIRVSVTVTEPTRLLSLIGIDSLTCTGTATASLATGVTGAP
jgi:Flp pilus assembly protein TadG